MKTIEEKLDWILEKVKDGNYKTGFSDDNKVIKELFETNDLSFNDTTLNYRHEYEQLLEMLINERYIEEDDARPIYTLTIKAKLFDGFKKEKIRRSWNERLTKAQTIIVSIGAVFAIFFGSMEVVQSLKPNNQSLEAKLNQVLLNQSQLIEIVQRQYLLEAEEKK